MIIGISGKIGSGKDTVGKIIQYLTTIKKDYGEHYTLEQYLQNNSLASKWLENHSNFKIKKFAGKLKQIVSILTGIPVEDLEKQEVKDKELGEGWWYYTRSLFDSADRYSYKEHKEKLNNNLDYYFIKPTVRQLLQEIGTEAMRDVIHPNIWVNALFADYKAKWVPTGDSVAEEDVSLEKEYPNWIITDMRFPNELQAVKDKGGISIRVDKYEGTKVISKYPHYSETALDNAEFDYTIENNAGIPELIHNLKNILTQEKIINE